MTKEKVWPPNSARYTPAIRPTGKPITAASSKSFKLPTMALAIPPPVSPTGFGSCVKRFQFREAPPCQIKYPRIRNNTETTDKAATPVRVSITTLSDFRQIKSARFMRDVLRRAQLPRSKSEQDHSR